MSALTKFFTRNRSPRPPSPTAADVAMMPSISEMSCNLLLIGPSGCGKTALVVKFLTGRFLSQFDREHDKLYTRRLNLDGKLIQLNILDKSGQGVMESVTAMSGLDNVQGLIVVFSLTESQSFNECLDLLDFFKFDCESTISIPTLVLGNKLDLSHGRRVESVEAEKCVLKYTTCSYEECSAAEPTDNIDTMFRSFIKQVLTIGDMRHLKTLNGRKVSVSVMGSPQVTRSHFKRRFSMFGRDKNGSN